MPNPNHYNNPVSNKKLYKLIIALYFAALIFIILFNKKDYLILLLICYLLTEFIFNPKSVQFKGDTLVIVKLYLGGIFRITTNVSIAKIIKIYPVPAFNGEHVDEDVSLFIFPGKGETPFGLYKTQYLDDNDQKKTISINLHSNEYNILNDALVFQQQFQRKEFGNYDDENGIVRYVENGFTISYEDFTRTFLWADITQINVFKEDLITTDRIAMEVICGTELFIIQEELPGWDEFVRKTKQIFPRIPQDWELLIVQPPFARNFRTIYSASKI